MSNLSIPGSQSTPTIEAGWDSGVLSMHGDSYPENSFELFGKVIRWVEQFLSATTLPFRLELHLLYLNTSSIKALMDILDLLEDAHHAGREVSVNWYYDQGNERVAQVAEEFKEDFSFAFSIIGKAR